MHAMKFVVAAAAALVVGTAGAETMQGSSASWSDESRSSISSPSQSSNSTFASEAYDGKQYGGWAETSSGAYGRSFSESTMTQEQSMVSPSASARASLSDGTRLNHFHGG